MQLRKHFGQDIFFKRHGYTLNLSAKLRDELLPCKNVKFFVETPFIGIAPSIDPLDYTLSISRSGQGKLTCCATYNMIHIPEGVRIYLSHKDENWLYFRVKEA